MFYLNWQVPKVRGKSTTTVFILWNIWMKIFASIRTDVVSTEGSPRKHPTRKDQRRYQRSSVKRFVSPASRTPLPSKEDGRYNWKSSKNLVSYVVPNFPRYKVGLLAPPLLKSQHRKAVVSGHNIWLFKYVLGLIFGRFWNWPERRWSLETPNPVNRRLHRRLDFSAWLFYVAKLLVPFSPPRFQMDRQIA